MFYRRIAVLFLTTALSVSALPAIAQEAEEDSGAILVLDASGSMWGKVGDKHKIEIARDVVGKTVSEWDAKTDLGLIAYGHNHKGDCDDIETLIAPGAVNVDEFNAKTEALNPKGMTPLSAAVLQAAETLKYRESKATVILISDGKETCDLDPCEIGRKLEDSGVDFTAHIIGFDVPEDDKAGLQCLADETGGMYIDARDASDLTEAMNNTREIITDEEALVLDEATLVVPAKVPAGSRFDVEWDGPKNKRDYLAIRAPGNDKNLHTVWVGPENVTSPSSMRAPETPGNYIVYYEAGPGKALGSAEFEAIAVTATLAAPDSVPAGSAFNVEWTGPMNGGDHVRIVSEDGEKKYDLAYAYQDNQNPAKLNAPEEIGRYELRFVTRGGKVLAARSFEVLDVAASMNAPDSVGAGSAFEVDWTGPMNSGDNIRIFSKDGEKKFDLAYAYQDNQNPANLNAPEEPGAYELRFVTRGGNVLATDSIEVVAVSASMDVPQNVPAGSAFKVDWAGPMNSGDNIRIVSQDGEKKHDLAYAYQENQNPAKLNAPEDVGTYQIRFTTRGGNVLASATFKVTPVTATLDFPARVSAAEDFVVHWTGPMNSGNNIRIFSEDGEKKFDVAYAYQDNQNPAKMTAPDKPGTYEVRFMTRGGNALATKTLIVE